MTERDFKSELIKEGMPDCEGGCPYWGAIIELIEELDEMRKELKEANEHIVEGIISEGELMKEKDEFAKHLHESHERYDRLSERMKKSEKQWKSIKEHFRNLFDMYGGYETTTINNVLGNINDIENDTFCKRRKDK